MKKQRERDGALSAKSDENDVEFNGETDDVGHGGRRDRIPLLECGR